MTDPLETERAAHEERLQQIETSENKVEEWQKYLAKWKEKFRRRVKSFASVTREPRNTHEFLEELDGRHDDLVQAGEFLQECYEGLTSLELELNHASRVETLTRDRNNKADDLTFRNTEYRDTRRGIITAMRKEAQEAQDEEIRRKRTQTEAQITQEVQAQAAARVTAENVQSGNQRGRSSGQTKIGNLKKVELPKFSGQMKEYFRWKSTFDVLVHNNEDLDDQARYLYLDQALVGEAHKLLEHLEYSGSSYNVAISLIEKKYGGKERQIQNLYNTMKNIKIVKDFHTLQEFQHTLLGISTMIENYHLDGEGTILHIQLCEKLNQRYMKDYLNFIERTGIRKCLASLQLYVEKEIEVSQAAYEATSSQVKPNEERKKRVVNNLNKKQKKCADCGEDHPVWGCDKFKKKDVTSRLDIVKKERLCFACLGKGHSKKDCRFKMKCDVEGCPGGHHKLLHQEIASTQISQEHVQAEKSPREDNKGSKENKKPSQEENTEEKKIVSSVNSKIRGRTVLNLVPLYLFKNNGKKKIRCLALLDSGSNTTLISEKLKRELGLHGRRETHLFHQPVGGSAIRREVEVIDEVKIESIKGDFTMKMKDVETMPNQLQAETVDWNHYKMQFDYLKHIDFPEVGTHEKADLLIGADQTLLFNQSDQRRPYKNGDPIALETPLGWICMGIIPAYQTVKQVNAVTVEREVYANFRTDQEEISETLKKFWQIDAFENSDKEISIENIEVLKDTREKTRYRPDEKRYEVSIPFNERKIEEVSEEMRNEMWSMAMKRLESTERRLKSKEFVKDKYQEVVENYLEKGYAKIAPDPENTRWLLPHFAVVKEDRETSKVRIVFDAAAKVKNVSLNDQISEGPKLQRDLFQVLLRFRRYGVAFSADIKEMFLGIGVSAQDRRHLRFLWRGLEDRQPDVLELQRVPFGINASPFLAINTLLDHAETYRKMYPRAVEALVESTYVDDTLDSVKTVSEAIELYQQINRIGQEAGWKIHKWSSNSPELLQQVPEEERTQGNPLEDKVFNTLSVKTLGIKWLPESDELTGDAKTIHLIGKVTKRVILQKVAKIFDPLGMLSPFVMQCKILLQEIWSSGKDWDEELDTEIKQKALDWFNQLQFADSIRQSRVLLLNPDELKQVEIHCFTDASEQAYGAVIYLKLIYEEEVAVKWVTAKGKVCPLEPISIPRLELMAAVLGAQLTDKVRKSLELDGIVTRMWTDSMTVMWWIIGRARNLKMFVGNRVLEIHKYTEPSQWRHVPGDQNPADIISRGCTLKELKENSLWENGPEFLKKDVKDWPLQVKRRTKEAEKEFKGKYIEEFINQMVKFTDNTEGQDESETSDLEDAGDDLIRRVELIHEDNHCDEGLENEDSIEKLCAQVKQLKVDSDVDYLSPERYSNINKLVRVRAYVKRFLHNAGVSKQERTTGCLQVWELEESEKEVIAGSQRKKFEKEYIALVRGKTVHANSKLIALNPQLDQDGLIRVGGRLQEHPNMSWDMQHPIILPKKSHVTDLVIRREHENNHMFGTNYLMGKLKEKYWILSARSQITVVTRRCMKCKRLKCKTMSQQMGLLPPIRTQMNLKAFVNVGVDMAGPVMVKIGRGKPQQKRWLCIFTCLSVRAVHLELCSGLDMDSFLNALTRFIARRGLPETILSDNGTNFRGADNEMKKLYEMFESRQFQEQCSQKRIKWRFNPPGGPHHGGVFEAMVKATKTTLREVLYKKSLTEEELQTALVSAEGMLNQRPLSYVGSEQEDFVLTPNHFLHGSLGGMLAPDIVDKTPTFQKKWRAVQEVLQEIWARWLREWVTELNKRKKWFDQEDNLKVGDVVLILEEDLSKTRGNFPIARVCEIHPGPDGLVRSCKVQTASGHISKKTIQRLVKIESS